MSTNGGAGNSRVQFREAVPLRRDRRDLRRRFRRAVQDAMSDQQAEMTAVLRRLAASQMLVTAVVPGTPVTGEMVGFADGTWLVLGIRRGAGDVDRLEGAGFRGPVWLESVQPCFGRRWFWLGFGSPGRAVPVEVLASVSPAAR